MSKSLKAKKNNQGFTLIELLVALTIFAIVISVVSGIFIRAMRAQRASVALLEINDNASLAIEKIARAIRTGSGFSVSPDGTQLSFTSADGGAITYLAQDMRLMERTGAATLPLTANNIRIPFLRFELLDTVNGATAVPRVTISMQIGSQNPGIEGITTDIQTTVSARALNS